MLVGLAGFQEDLKRSDIRALNNLVDTIETILNNKKREMALIRLVPSIVVKNAIENQVRLMKISYLRTYYSAA